MSCKRRAVAWILIALAGLVGCRKEPAGAPAGRIAVLRFENLSPDQSLSWMGRAFSEVIAAQLANGGPGGPVVVTSLRLHSFDRVLGVRPVSAPGISSERTEAVLAGAARIVYGEFTVRRGKLEARVTIENTGTGRMERTLAVSAPPGDVLAAAGEIARAIDASAAPYGTRSGAALSGYIHALEAGDAGAMEQSASAAIQADPDFAPPYRVLAQERLLRGDAPGAAAILEQALARGDRVPPLERARIELQAAEIAQDPNAQQAALLKLVKLDASDPAAWRALADGAMNHHDYRRAAESYRKAVEIEPGDTAAWNTLGYASAYAGDLAGGVAALRRYQALAPNDVNPIDSLGDIHLIQGKLADAMKFYQEASQKDPNFLNQGDLLKAAVAAYYSGDAAAADQAMERYFAARGKAQDPILEYRRAQWLWLRGQRTEGFRRMQAFAAANQNGALRDTASRAGAELSLWSLMLGDRAAAMQLAVKALGIASPAARGNALVAAFLAQDPAPASEWTVRAERLFGGAAQAGIRNFALAHALLLNREFPAAQLLLKQMWESGGTVADEGMPVMLAWADIETGRFDEAAPLLVFNPLPNTNGLTPYASFYLPRIFYLRGALAAKQSRAGDAASEFRKFLAFSGGTPLIWGEEAKARR